MKVVGCLSLFLMIILAGSYKYLEHVSQAVPYPSPEHCPDIQGRKIVAIGDSLTHGKVSSDYLAQLPEANGGAIWINGGINSRLAYNALQNAHDIVACQPEAITILIGSNDVLANYSSGRLAYYMERWDLPREPDFKFYQQSLRELIDILQKQTDAKIAIFSLPPVGEKPQSRMNNIVGQYNAFIRQVAEERKLHYLPLNETMWQSLNRQAQRDIDCAIDDGLMEKAILQYRLLGKSWDQISERNGLQLLTDCIHLNDREATMVARLAHGFLQESD